MWQDNCRTHNHLKPTREIPYPQGTLEILFPTTPQIGIQHSAAHRNEAALLARGSNYAHVKTSLTVEAGSKTPNEPGELTATNDQIGLERGLRNNGMTTSLAKIASSKFNPSVIRKSSTSPQEVGQNTADSTEALSHPQWKTQCLSYETKSMDVVVARCCAVPDDRKHTVIKQSSSGEMTILPDIHLHPSIIPITDSHFLISRSAESSGPETMTTSRGQEGPVTNCYGPTVRPTDRQGEPLTAGGWQVYGLRDVVGVILIIPRVTASDCPTRVLSPELQPSDEVDNGIVSSTADNSTMQVIV